MTALPVTVLLPPPLAPAADKTVRVWRGEGESWACAATLAEHTKEVVGLTVHPSHR